MNTARLPSGIIPSSRVSILPSHGSWPAAAGAAAPGERGWRRPGRASPAPAGREARPGPGGVSAPAPQGDRSRRWQQAGEFHSQSKGRGHARLRPTPLPAAAPRGARPRPPRRSVSRAEPVNKARSVAYCARINPPPSRS